MRFREGMLGITVVMVAIAVGLLGGWAMSTDVNDVEITIYNELTEITPLFGSENTPQYTTYNPSSNYTGYYTDNSIINDTKYFDGVDFTSSSRANSYRLNLAPIDSDSGAYSVASSDAGRWDVMYFTSNSTHPMITSVNHLSLDNLVTNLGIAGFTKFVITNDAQPSDWTTTDTFITFGTTDLLNKVIVPVGADKGLVYKNPTLTGNLQIDNFGGTIPASTAADPILALSYDSIIGSVELFADVDRTVSLGLYSPSEVFIIAGGTNASFVFGSDVDYLALKFPLVTYLDPSKGVELT